MFSHIIHCKQQTDTEECKTYSFIQKEWESAQIQTQSNFFFKYIIYTCINKTLEFKKKKP